MLLCDQLPHHNTKAEDVSSLIAPADVSTSKAVQAEYICFCGACITECAYVDAKTGTDGSVRHMTTTLQHDAVQMHGNKHVNLVRSK